MPAIHQLLIVFSLLTHIAMASAADIPFVLDIHDDHIEAKITLPTPEKATIRTDLSVNLQTLLNFTTPDGQPMTSELIGSGESATLHVYPPDDIIPPAFIISTNAPNHRVRILLRQDPAEMRLGIEPPLHLGSLDSFKNSLMIEREFPAFSVRVFAAFTSALQLLLTQTTPILILFLLSTTLTQPAKSLLAFAQAGLAILAFFTGTSIALIFETHLAPTPLTVLLIVTIATLSFHVWRPIGTTPRLISIIAAGWITGVSWNNTWLPQGTFATEPLLILSATVLPALIALTVLAFPSLLLLSRQLPLSIFHGAATLCGIIVILLQLTTFARPA